MNNKAQINPLATFIIIVVAVLIVGVFMSYLLNTILTPIGATFGNESLTAGTTVTYVTNVFNNFWDWVIVMVILLNMILLFITAFLIDTHPAFVVFYIFSCFVLFITGGALTMLLDDFYDNPVFLATVAHLPLSDFIRTHFMMVLLGTMALSGVVIYAKVTYFPSGNLGGGSY